MKTEIEHNHQMQSSPATTLGLIERARQITARARPKRKHRQVHIDQISALAPSLIEDTGGLTLFSAKAVLDALVKRRYGRSAKGKIIPRSPSIGDTLGRHGLDLPSFKDGGRRYFALDMIGATEEEKRRVQEQLDAIPQYKLRAMGLR